MIEEGVSGYVGTSSNATCVFAKLLTGGLGSGVGLGVGAVVTGGVLADVG
jgi:hypothetical protein